jgi:hypothetical protein
MVFDAIAWRPRVLVVIFQNIEKARMPGFSRFERDLEAETTVRIDGLFRKIMRGNYNGPAEVAVAIGCVKLLVCLRPFGCDPPPAYNVARLHLEEIREVATDGDFKLKFYRLHAVIGNVEIFVHAARNPSADGKAERTRRNDTRFRRERTVRKEDARCVIGDGAAIQQLPRFSIGVDGPTADDARIEEIKTPFTWPIDLSVGIANQDGLPLVDGDLRRTNLNHERHGDALPWAAPTVGAWAE